MSASEVQTQYVAVLKIEKVVRRMGAGGMSGTRVVTDEKSREMSDVTHLTIRAKSLDDLKSRITAHVELVEDD